MILKRELLFILLTILSSAAIGQDLIMQSFRLIPQRTLENPAYIPDYKAFVGIPAVSSISSTFSNTVAWDDIFVVEDDDSLVLDMDHLLSTMGDRNYIALTSGADYLSLGLRIGKGFFTFEAGERATVYFAFPKDMIELAWMGNAPSAGTEMELGLSINATNYSFLGFGFGRKFNERLTLGSRINVLFGRANIWTKNSGISLLTDPDNYNLTLKSDYALYTAGAAVSIDYNYDFSSSYDESLYGLSNPGIALDMAASYLINDRIEISGGFNDLGFIHWTQNAKSHVVEEGSYTFTGIDLGGIFDIDDNTIEDKLDAIVDTLKETFNIKETQENYYSPLTTRAFVRGGFALTKNDYASAQVRAVFFDGAILPSLTMSFNHTFFDAVELAVSYSMLKNSYNNLGGGLSARVGPLQIYMMNDNLLSLINWQAANLASTHFGFNLILGRKKDVVIAEPAAQ